MNELFGYSEERVYSGNLNGVKLIVTREYGINPISGLPFKGTWVLRNFNTGEYLDSDQYRNSLLERANIASQSSEKPIVDKSDIVLSVYSGPYGTYKAGSVGAVLNALCTQEKKPLHFMDSLVIGNNSIVTRDGGHVVAKFTWAGNEITFDWNV